MESQKFNCEICKGKYTSRHKTDHEKSKKHIRALNGEVKEYYSGAIHYQENKDKYKENAKKWKAENPEKTKIHRKTYYQNRLKVKTINIIK